MQEKKTNSKLERELTVIYTIQSLELSIFHLMPLMNVQY